VEQGKLLGFIVSKDGMIIDPERTQAIAKLPPPSSKKAMQSFLGKINFVRRFVPSFSEMVRPLQNLIKKMFCIIGDHKKVRLSTQLEKK
jgi:hypothetical protein